MNTVVALARSPFAWLGRLFAALQVWMTLRWAEDERSYYRQQPGAQLHVVRQMDRDIEDLRERLAALLDRHA